MKETNPVKEYAQALMDVAEGHMYFETENDIIEISIPLDKEKEEQCYLYYGDKHYEEKGYVPLGIEGIVRIETSYPVKQKMSELSTHFEGKPDYTMVCKAKYNISKIVEGRIWKVYEENSVYLLKKGKDDDYYTIVDVYSGLGVSNKCMKLFTSDVALERHVRGLDTTSEF